MKITTLTLYKQTLKTATEIKHVQFKGKTVDIVFAKLETNEGDSGFGAVPSRSYITGETADSIISTIKEKLQHVVIDENPFNLEKIIYNMDQATQYCYGAKALIDLALHDLLGQITKQPVYNLIGGRCKEKIPAFTIIGLLAPVEAGKEAVKKYSQGFRDFKIKTGENFERDVERIREVRKAVGDRASLRVDCNASWNVKEALHFIGEMDNLNVHIVEQPIPPSDLVGLKLITESSKMNIMADESADNMSNIYQLIRQRIVDMINIKVIKVGGLYKAKKIAAIAEAAGISCLAGCSVQNNIPDAAAAHLYLSSKNVIYHEIKAPTRIVNDPAVGLEIDHGEVLLPEGPGFGLTISLDSKYQV